MTVIDDNLDVSASSVPPTMAERITLILDQFDGAGTRLTAEELVQLTHIPRSTTHRILDQLTQLNWLRHNRFGYRLGWRAIALGRSTERDELRAVAAPHLHQLHLRTRLITHLSVLDGRDIVWLDKVGGRCADSIATRVGDRSRADRTVEGRSMLALLPPEHVDALYRGALAPAALSDLHRQLGIIRTRSGRAWDTDPSGVLSVAAAMCSGETDSAQLGCISLRGRVHTDQLQRALPLLAGATRMISARIAEG
ncbi:IclR family transcriptional regulator [Rhodococcus sp. AG1013]|uniref:IclR family transcriptional regulator n=1 Tax=unclassified Rhodococcus (in: high G+C Gram-positive bacteria) TaxID=192944 RepID=UPI000E0A23E8|nr:helix-turn-helix domain-containing protein [Rhodococcus sp. AG1013]RDI30363.1 DNA-binding IclR family transcriptional regulator [Rhodococcus sp. AG1013]